MKYLATVLIGVIIGLTVYIGVMYSRPNYETQDFALPEVVLNATPGQKSVTKEISYKLSHKLGYEPDVKLLYQGTEVELENPYRNSVTNEDDGVTTTTEITYVVTKESVDVKYRATYTGGYGRNMTIQPLPLTARLSKPLFK